MAHSYITDTEFRRICPQVVKYFHSRRIIDSWEVHSGTIYKSFSTGLVELLFQDGEELAASEADLVAVDTDKEWYYDPLTDILYLQSATDPDEENIEAGEDYATFVTERIKNASRMIDSKLDGRHSVPFAKNQSGVFDQVILEITAYQLAVMVIGPEDANLRAYFENLLSNEEGTGLIDLLWSGKIKLEYEVDADSARGEIRTISVSGEVHLTRTRGAWTGTGHDRLKVYIETGGAEGTMKYRVLGHDADLNTEKTLEIVAAIEIDLNQWVSLGRGLQGMFEADSGDTATLNDEWEVEVHGADSQTTNPQITSAPLTRRGTTVPLTGPAYY